MKDINPDLEHFRKNKEEDRAKNSTSAATQFYRFNSKNGLPPTATNNLIQKYADMTEYCETNDSPGYSQYNLTQFKENLSEQQQDLITRLQKLDKVFFPHTVPEHRPQWHSYQANDLSHRKEKQQLDASMSHVESQDYQDTSLRNEKEPNSKQIGNIPIEKIQKLRDRYRELKSDMVTGHVQAVIEDKLTFEEAKKIYNLLYSDYKHRNGGKVNKSERGRLRRLLSRHVDKDTKPEKRKYTEPEAVGRLTQDEVKMIIKDYEDTKFLNQSIEYIKRKHNLLTHKEKIAIIHMLLYNYKERNNIGEKFEDRSKEYIRINKLLIPHSEKKHESSSDDEDKA